MMDHPLTDEEITNFAQPEIGYFDLTGLDGASEVSLGYDSDDLRAAADWQLECDAEWWKILLNRMKIFHPNAVDLIVEEFKQKMRPQQQQENN